jgi:ribosomal protein S18 acetylase RimI-like enzyme
MDTIRLKPSDKKSAAEVFARSFFEYPMITFYWPDKDRRKRYLEWYLGCVLNYGFRYGEVYSTPGIAGIAIWLSPGQTHLTTRRYIRAGFLLAPLRMGINHYFTQTTRNEELVMQVHEEIMPGAHWYLWAIAVDPDRQGQGIGTILMQPGLEHADAQQLPCYLETHDEKNLPFYQKQGFDMVRSEQVPGSELRFWCFVREPRRLSA